MQTVVADSAQVAGRSGFGARLAYAIEEVAQITQAELARRLEILPQQVSKWLRREEAPPEDSVRRLAEALGVTAEWLRYGGSTGVVYQRNSVPSSSVLREEGGRYAPDELWAELPNTAYLHPGAQEAYDRHLGSYMRRRWSREEIVEAARTLVRPIEGSNTMWMQGRGKDLSEDEQILVIEEMASIVESLMGAKARGRSS